MSTIAVRLTEAADYLDYLHEGAKHIPADLERNTDIKGLVAQPERPDGGVHRVAQFFYGGAAEVFLALGPAVLPLLAKLLREEARNVAMSESINGLLAQIKSDAQPMYLESALAAVTVADHILKSKES